MRVLYSVFSHEQATEDLSKSSAISGSLLWSGCQQRVCSLYSLGKKKIISWILNESVVFYPGTFGMH